MSSCRYYEFLALDGPISDEGLRYAECCSSRAQVSRHQWKNVYHWGDFSGRVDELLKYYDAFYYFADWGSCQFSLAFPEGCFSEGTIEPYLTAGGYEFGAGVSRSGGDQRPVLTWEYQEEGTYWDGFEDAAGLLGRLTAIREQIMLGDYRALFIGWLAGFDPEWVDREDAPLPPVPPGMDQLSDALHCLADQMRVDQDLLQAAAGLSSARQRPKPTPISDVVNSLPVSEMQDLLVRVAEGDGGRVKAQLIQKMRPLAPDPSRRITCGAFAGSVLEVREARARERAIQQEEKRREDERIRREHLGRVLQQSEEVWKRLDQWVEKKTSSAYDSAFEQLKELRDAYALAGEDAEFEERLSLFRMCYGRRPALMRRIKKL